MTEFAPVPDGAHGPLPLRHFERPPTAPDDGGDGLSLRGFIGAIRRNLWVLVLFTLIGLGLTAFALTRTEQLYTSQAVIQLPDQQAAGGGSGLAGLAATLTGAGGSLTSQAQVIRSRLLVGQLVDSLGLRLVREVKGVSRSLYRPVGYIDQVVIAPGLQSGTVDFVFREDRVRVSLGEDVAEAAYGERVELPGLSFVVPVRPPVMEELQLLIVSRDAGIDSVTEEMRVYVRESTNLIDIVVTGYDPYITQRIADATAGLYRGFTAQRAREQAEKQREFVLTQLETTEGLLRETQDELTDFRRREGLYSSRSQAIMDQTGQAELELREAELIADRQMYQGFLERVRQLDRPAERLDVFRAIISSPTVATNPALTATYDLMSRYQLQRDSIVTGPSALAARNRDVQRLDSLIARTEQSLLSLTESHVESLNAQIAAVSMVRSRVDSAFQHLAATEPEELRLMLRLESITDAAGELRQRYYSAGIAEAGVIDQVTILDRALPGGPTGTGPVRSLILGLLLGLLVGSAAAVALDSMNRSIRKHDEIERVLRVQALGVIPQIPGAGASRSRLRLPAAPWSNGSAVTAGSTPKELVSAGDVHSFGAEAYRTVRTNLLFAQSTRKLRSIMVTSASNGEGKTMTAANLAVTFAHQRRRVLLIDADLRRPRIHSLFDVSRSPGLGELLRQEAGSADHVIQSTSIPLLSVLTAGGNLPVSAADLVGGEAIRRLLDELVDDFDIIIIDSPPVLLTADAPILATQVDGVLLVVRAGETDKETAQYALHQLSAVGARLVGAVLNDPDAMLGSSRAYETGTYV